MIRAALWPLLAAQAVFLRWCIRGDEDYLAQCAADGLIDSLSLRHFRAQIEITRVRLADIEARMQPIGRTAL